MRYSLFLLAIVLTLFSFVDGRSPTKQCNKQIKRYKKCLKKGFQSSLGCVNAEKHLKSKRKYKKCAKIEGAVKDCGYSCAVAVSETWSENAGKYLSGYSAGNAKYDSLLQAQAECLKRSDCSGITFEPSTKKYTLRQGVDLKDSPSNEVSYMVKPAADCQVGKGESYRGKVAVTKSGLKCQIWDSQAPNEHTRTPASYPDSGLNENYCRNPDGESGAWCYNDEGTSPRWELCDIPSC